MRIMNFPQVQLTGVVQRQQRVGTRRDAQQPDRRIAHFVLRQPGGFAGVQHRDVTLAVSEQEALTAVFRRHRPGPGHRFERATPAQALVAGIVAHGEPLADHALIVEHHQRHAAGQESNVDNRTPGLDQRNPLDRPGCLDRRDVQPRKIAVRADDIEMRLFGREHQETDFGESAGRVGAFERGFAFVAEERGLLDRTDQMDVVAARPAGQRSIFARLDRQRLQRPPVRRDLDRAFAERILHLRHDHPFAVRVSHAVVQREDQRASVGETQGSTPEAGLADAKLTTAVPCTGN